MEKTKLDSELSHPQSCEKLPQIKPKNVEIPTKVENESSIELFRHQNYYFRRLIQKDRAASLQLLSQQFKDQQPLTNAFHKRYPFQGASSKALNGSLAGIQFEDEKQIDFMKKVWSEFWRMFIRDSIDNQMSVAVFDLQRNGELIGISVAKDLNYVPEGFEEKFMKDLNYISSVIALQEEMFKKAKPQHHSLFREKGLVMDIWGVALKKEHMGKRLLHKMMIGNETLGIRQGFRYGFSYASNFKTGIALSKLNYEKISEIECKEFDYLGVKPFELVEQAHHRPSLWLKQLK